MNIKEKFKQYLHGRKIAYCQVFNPESQAVQRVLKDLAIFCRANESCFHADPRVHAVAEGRREVYLRILEHVKMDPETFWTKYGREDL
jgi:hypothetical protein